MNLDEQHLADILLSVGEHLETSSPSVRRVVNRSARKRSTAIKVAVIALTLSATTIAVPSVRAAVGNFLRIGSTTIDVRPTPSVNVRPTPSVKTTEGPLDALTTGLVIVDRTTAESLLDAEVPDLQGRLSAFDASSLGTPGGYAVMPEGGLLTIWTDGSTLWVHRSSVRPEDYFRKMVSTDRVIRKVSGLGDDAISIEGQHWLTTPHRTVSSNSTVLWVANELEFRFESNRTITQIIDAARSISTSLKD